MTHTQIGNSHNDTTIVTAAYDYGSDAWRVEIGEMDANGNLDTFTVEVHDVESGNECDAWALARELAATRGLHLISP